MLPRVNRVSTFGKNALIILTKARVAMAAGATTTEEEIVEYIKMRRKFRFGEIIIYNF